MRNLQLFYVLSAAAWAFSPMSSAAENLSAGLEYSATVATDSRSGLSLDISPSGSLDGLVRELESVVENLSRHKIPFAPPVVYQLPQAHMQAYVCRINCAIKAWYEPGVGILLDQTLHPESNLFDRSILLHELVHYFQDMDGYFSNGDTCSRWVRRELDAYEIQNRYLSAIEDPHHVAYVGPGCPTAELRGRFARPAMLQDQVLR